MRYVIIIKIMKNGLPIDKVYTSKVFRDKYDAMAYAELEVENYSNNCEYVCFEVAELKTYCEYEN